MFYAPSLIFSIETNGQVFFFVVSKFGGSISKSTTIRFDMPNEIAFQWDIDLELVRVHSKVS